MFHLIINEDSKNDETLIVSYNGKQWDFTLNMTNEFAQKFYEILKENKTIILPMSPLDSNKELLYAAFSYINVINGMLGSGTFYPGEIIVGNHGSDPLIGFMTKQSTLNLCKIGKFIGNLGTDLSELYSLSDGNSFPIPFVVSIRDSNSQENSNSNSNSNSNNPIIVAVVLISSLLVIIIICFICI